MEPKALEEFGLTKGESKVYLSLLNLGKSTIGNLLKQSQVSHSKIYDILERLSQKGLISTATEKNKKTFIAQSPERIKEILNIKEQEIKAKKQNLEKLLPELTQIHIKAEPIQEAETLHGIKGIKTFLDSSLNELKKEDVVYVLGAPKQANEKIEAYLLDWHKRRIAKGVKCKIIYNSDAKEYAKKRKKLSLTAIKFFPPNLNSPVVTTILGSKTGTQVYNDNPFCFSIKNKEIADSYKNYFNYLWKLAKSQQQPL